MITMDEKNVRFLGRTYYHKESAATYFNWTCSGFEFQFEGTKAEAELVTLEEHARECNLRAFVAVFVNDSDEPYKRFCIDKAKDWYTLFEAKEVAIYKIKVLKITEAQFGSVGLSRIRIEGIPKSLPEKPLRHKIEFIGDSITCGYGNEAKSPEVLFRTNEENGWEAFAAKTSRKLNCEFNCVSSSGIGIYSSYTGTDNINDTMLMPKLYNYTDRFFEQSLGRTSFEEWNFSTYVPDLIVINLGTNDGSYIKYKEERKLNFRELYIKFLKQVREKNGAYPKILCTIGSIDLSLYDEIAAAVEEYSAETCDTAIDIMKFELQLEADGIGGSFHPSIATHEKMSAKLCSKIKEYMNW